MRKIALPTFSSCAQFHFCRRFWSKKSPAIFFSFTVRHSNRVENQKTKKRSTSASNVLCSNWTNHLVLSLILCVESKLDNSVYWPLDYLNEAREQLQAVTFIFLHVWINQHQNIWITFTIVFAYWIYLLEIPFSSITYFIHCKSRILMCFILKLSQFTQVKQQQNLGV